MNFSLLTNEKKLPIRIKKNHWNYEIYANHKNSIAIQKSTQCGISLYSTVTALEMALEGLNQFYVLPTEPLRNRFVSRVNEIISNNQRYKKEMKVDSVSQKQMANSFIAFVYSNSESQFQEFPADCVTIDELDKCDQDNVKRAVSRLGNSEYRIIRRIGNPSIKDYGIDKEMKKTDLRRWHIKCDSCNHWQTPDFFSNVVSPQGECLDLDYRIGESLKAYCTNCHVPIDLKKEGEWIAENPKSLNKGYFINKLFSGNVPLSEIYEGYKDALNDDSALARFYNDDLGLSYTPAGSKIALEMILGCIDKEYKRFPDSYNEKLCFMGIDVGTKLHCTILDTDNRLVYAGGLRTKDDILDIAKRYNVRIGVIDALPEIRLVHELQSEITNLFRCLYLQGHEFSKTKIESRTISVDRTSALDTVKTNFVKGVYKLPLNIETVDNKDFVNHLQNSTRIIDLDGNRSKWVDTGPDHYFHSLSYCNLAGSLMVHLSR